MSVIENRTVVITGAGHGIGAALAHEAANRGASLVLVCDIDAAAATSVAELIGERAEARTIDVTDTAGVFALADEAVKDFGVPGLVCANAGVAPAQGPTLDLDLTDARWVMEVNTLGVLATLQAFGRPMANTDDRSCLLATASEHGLGRPHPGLGIYTASKHAIVGMCDVMRTELPAHMGLSVLCPGLTQTDFANAQTRRTEPFGGAGEPNPMGAMLLARGMPASVVASRALDGVEAGQFLIATHYNALGYATSRYEEVAAAFERLAEIDTTNWDVGDVLEGMLNDQNPPDA
ncbi:MAG: SDR family NAD(P)-dependent oxidoreductase [Microthrixaceae bacterium]